MAPLAAQPAVAKKREPEDPQQRPARAAHGPEGGRAWPVADGRKIAQQRPPKRPVGEVVVEAHVVALPLVGPHGPHEVLVRRLGASTPFGWRCKYNK